MAAPSQADETEDVGAMCNLLLLSPSKRLQKSLSQETALRVLAVLRRRNAAGQSVLEKMCYKQLWLGHEVHIVGLWNRHGAERPMPAKSHFNKWKLDGLLQHALQKAKLAARSYDSWQGGQSDMAFLAPSFQKLLGTRS